MPWLFFSKNLIVSLGFNMNFLVSGHTSEIAKQVVKQFKTLRSDIKVHTVGRNTNSDIYCDFSEHSSISRLINEVLPELELSHLFLNHGILLGEKALNLSEKQVSEYMMVNCYSFIAVLEAISSCKGLNTVVMSSISGKEGSYDPIYAATKAGVDSFRYKASKQFDASSRLNYISPGIVADARMTLSRKDVDNLTLLKGITPTQNFTNSREVADMVVFLLTNPGNINFQDIAINGGMSLNR